MQSQFLSPSPIFAALPPPIIPQLIQTCCSCCMPICLSTCVQNSCGLFSNSISNSGAGLFGNGGMFGCGYKSAFIKRKHAASTKFLF